ncbi:aminoacyl-tRNA hydrolase [Dietzia timorensis]|nr:aminoacyl-tRNA hydrolase [Dietzia timorensis]
MSEDAGAGATGPMQWLPARGEQRGWCLAKLREVAGGPPRFAPPERPRAMQIALELPKVFDDRPGRSLILAAAARAVARFCLDARVAPGGEWNEAYTAWVGSQMRKVARRARGSHWTATETLAGVEAREGEAAARVFVPGPLDAVDPLIQRLQVGGTDAPTDTPQGRADVPSAVILLVDGELEMSAGKAAAQAGHAIMLLLAALDEERVSRWIDDGMPIDARRADREDWAGAKAAVDAGRPGYAGVRDAGYTEVAPGSLTVIGVDPETAKGV